MAFQPDLPYRDIWLELGDPTDDGGHAHGFATSLALHLRPGLVRTDRISNPDSYPIDWEDPDLNFARYSATGVIGNPTVATASLGARLWPEVVARSAAIFASLAHHH